MTGRTINAPDWLTARPIAHRGLHSKQFGLVENTPAAAAAAIAKNYAIECDVQRTKDGEAVVFHDFTLDRLMRAEGRVDAFRADELGQLAYKDCDQRIVSLTDFLARIGGRTPVIVEIKSRYDGDMRLADRALATVAAYPGPVCLKSFDPAVLVHLRGAGAACPLGLVAQARYDRRRMGRPSAREARELRGSPGLSARAAGFPIVESCRFAACRADALPEQELECRS